MRLQLSTHFLCQKYMFRKEHWFTKITLLRMLKLTKPKTMKSQILWIHSDCFTVNLFQKKTFGRFPLNFQVLLVSVLGWTMWTGARVVVRVSKIDEETIPYSRSARATLGIGDCLVQCGNSGAIWSSQLGKYVVVWTLVFVQILIA